MSCPAVAAYRRVRASPGRNDPLQDRQSIIASRRDGARATLDSPGVPPVPKGQRATQPETRRDNDMDAQTTTCPRCQGTGTRWYQGGGNGDYYQAACDLCGNGMVNSTGSGVVPA